MVKEGEKEKADETSVSTAGTSGKKKPVSTLQPLKQKKSEEISKTKKRVVQKPAETERAAKDRPSRIPVLAATRAEKGKAEDKKAAVGVLHPKKGKK